jgi:hypothetical protein
MASPTEPSIIVTKQFQVPLSGETGRSTWTLVFTSDGKEMTVGMHWGDKEHPTHSTTFDMQLMRHFIAHETSQINLLEELGKHSGWELNKGYKNGDEEGEYGWCVHEIRGGVNDREWHLIGFGDSPGLAIMRAIEACQ